jgi:hypothetical protein
VAERGGFEPQRPFRIRGAEFNPSFVQLGEPHGFFLRGPEQREIDQFGQDLGGELGWLVICADRLDNSGARNASRSNRLTYREPTRSRSAISEAACRSNAAFVEAATSGGTIYDSPAASRPLNQHAAFEGFFENNAVMGTPEYCLDKFHDWWKKLRFTHLTCHFNIDLRHPMVMKQLELFARYVLPDLKGIDGRN